VDGRVEPGHDHFGIEVPMSLTLVIGNKNYSSWSMRPWIALKAAAIPFEEVMIPLDLTDTKERIHGYSGAGKVPILIDGEIKVWESLAILDYIAEHFPQARLWPDDRGARAHARSAATEMHGGFAALREHCPMNLWRPVERLALTREVERDVERLTEIWREARKAYGQKGPFLYEGFTAADAMFAPVATRFHTYDIRCDEVSRAYIDAMHAHEAFRAWRAGALAEEQVIQASELDWPKVKKVADAKHRA
jgi:glutathione S-transferase